MQIASWVLAALVAVAAAGLLLEIWTLYKVRNVHLLLFKVLDRMGRPPEAAMLGQTRQLESLIGLYVDLRLTHALGPTRGWFASPDFLALAARLAMHGGKPEIVVECGSGTSTLVLGRCMQLNGRGHVHSLEHDPTFAKKTRQELARMGLEEWATVHDAPLVSYDLSGTSFEWYTLATLPSVSIDLVVVDGPPAPIGPLARYPALPLLWDRLASGALLLLDDASRPDEQTVLRRWALEFPLAKFEQFDLEKGAAVVTVRPDRHNGATSRGVAAWVADEQSMPPRRSRSPVQVKSPMSREQ